MTTVIDAFSRWGLLTIGSEALCKLVDLSRQTAGFASLDDFVIEQRHGAIEH
jgi:hypothetical protein